MVDGSNLEGSSIREDCIDCNSEVCSREFVPVRALGDDDWDILSVEEPSAVNSAGFFLLGVEGEDLLCKKSKNRQEIYL